MSAISSQRVVLPDGMRPATIHLDGWRIAAIEPYTKGAAVDAGDAVIMPGLVDTHVHVNEPGRTDWEGFASATRAAAAGGITTIVDMPLNSIPPTTTVRALDAKRRAAEGRCHVDVGFLPLETMIDWVADWVGRGQPSLGKPTHFETRDGKY